MELFTYYLRYLTAVCEGTLTVEGFSAEGADETEKAMDLQQKIANIGIPEFVRRCAAAEGTEIPQTVFDSFDPAALVQAMKASLAGSPEAGTEARSEAAVPLVEEKDSSAQAPQNDNGETNSGEKQNAYEAFLDCLALEDALIEYLIDVLLREDELAFFRLSQVTVRRELRLHDFLYWLGTKELYADEAERACATILDACIERLRGEGRMELIAALISGDRRTFELFRVDAPELRQLPEATYEWFEEYYLNRYYPYRAILRLRGVQFPKFDFDRAAGN